MRLLLHIGTEKTGSSFLQQLSARNREFLLKGGVFFPDAGRDERRLMEGTISPGNARELGVLVSERKWAAVSRWLETRVQGASLAGCDRLLLSNELLFAALSHDKSVSCFEVAARKAGVISLQSLLMIRDPVDQAVSLFKHRAKNGKVDDLSKWIQTKYTLPGELEQFLEQVEDSAIDLSIRKYTKDAGKIVESFFGDWLGVETPPNSIDALVNSSLTLSELRAIRQLAMVRPAGAALLYSKLLAVPHELKASDEHLEVSARVEAENYLCRFNEIWGELSRRLSRDGGIALPVPQPEPPVTDVSYRFSDAQLLALAEGDSETLAARYRIRSWLHRLLRRPYGILKATVGAIRNGRMD